MNKKTQALITKLAELYPNPSSELNFQNEYELVIAVLLSAQCTDKKVNDVTPTLFGHYPNFEKLAAARLPTLEKILRPINYYRTKAKHVRELAKKVLRDFNGALPRSHKELTTLPGVGQKTANVIQSERGIEPTFPVDTHVFRLAHRLGLSEGKNVQLVEEDLMKIFPKSSWRDLHHQLIFHGRRVCKARTPLCGECALNRSCPSFQK